MNIDRSFMAVCTLSGKIFAIGGYEYNEKVQLKSIEVYNIENDKWEANVYEDLKIGRSQANALVFNSDILVFGGYNKNFGTLNSIEKINLKSKTTDLLEIKLPIPLRRSASLKISNNQCIIFGGISRLCKESDVVYCYNVENNSFTQFSPLPKPGIIEHEILVDEKGTLHLFFENNYGTSPPIHATYNYLDFS
jgi:N-acetylneuraminic acid mutarotase